MSKKCMIERHTKKLNLVKKYEIKRKELKLLIAKSRGNIDEVVKLSMKLNNLPRSSSPIRVKNICKVTGRSKGVYSFFGLSRNKLREIGSFGNIPGLRKSSW